MPQTPLFTAADLSGLLGKPVTDERATAAERVVWGWLLPKINLTERPDPVPDDLYAWALELGAIAHENPAGFAGQANGPFSVQFSAERRAAILAEVEASQWGSKGTSPVGNFPCAWDYPDPARQW